MADGTDLTSQAPGGWLPSWLVIGREGLCGDPVFVDLAKPGFPVYTAIHGEGEWDPTVISDSFSAFVSALSALQSVSEGRDNPVELERNPVEPAMLDSLLERIQSSNPQSDINFWGSWFEID